MRRIYLDHTAATPLDERVGAAMQPFHSGRFANPSSIHADGRAARAALEAARAALARIMGCTPGELTFTSGGTESNTLALLGTARALRPSGRTVLVTAAAEHHAVLEPLRSLQEEGWELRILPVEPDGRLSPERLARAVDERTALVSVMHANNETGVINDVQALAAIAHRAGALLHTDAVQSLGKIPLNMRTLDADLVTVSAHKLYGPKGIGALCIRKGTAIEPVQRGGGQERGRRAGTESVALAVGFAEAARLAEDTRDREGRRLAELRDRLQAELERVPGLVVNGAAAPRLPHVLSISFDAGRRPMEGETLLMNMDLEGISVTSGSACTSGSVQPSHVLLAMGRDPATAAASLRFAFGRGNGADDLPAVIAALERSLGRMERAG